MQIKKSCITNNFFIKFSTIKMNAKEVMQTYHRQHYKYN